jgi:alkylation response protein AidB-like acyl-CoA dehydrogenase
MTTTATPVTDDDGTVTGYRLNGRKQWISNGSIADYYTILAPRPGGPTWFVVAKGAEGFTAGPRGQARASGCPTPPRCSSTMSRSRSEPRRRPEGLGLVQAQQVFGYTRLMVAAFGLGGGWEALDRAIAYSSASRAAARSARSRATRTS